MTQTLADTIVSEIMDLIETDRGLVKSRAVERVEILLRRDLTEVDADDYECFSIPSSKEAYQANVWTTTAGYAFRVDKSGFIHFKQVDSKDG